MLGLEKHEVVERGTRQPTAEGIRELVAFLPRLYAEGFEPIIGYYGGVHNEDGVYVLPQPMCHELVNEFVDVILKQDCWNDHKYLSSIEKLNLKCKSDITTAIATASLEEMKTLIAYFIRRERFCDGHWGSMIKSGYVRLLLERLSKME